MVPRILKILLPVFSLFALGGCAGLGALGPSSSSSSTTTAAAPAASAASASVPSIIAEIETSTKLAVFSPAAMLDSNAWLDAIIVDAQCRFHTPDPPFLVPT